MTDPVIIYGFEKNGKAVGVTVNSHDKATADFISDFVKDGADIVPFVSREEYDLWWNQKKGSAFHD